MEITEIKSRLNITGVLQHYGLKPDRNQRLSCPFHPDKTPSMQVYEKTNTVYCFSSNCPTHGKSMDTIDFILHKENCTKAEAIKRAIQMLNGENQKSNPAQQITRVAILTKMFSYFKNAVHNSKPAQEYLKKRGIDPTKTEVGYNTGQFHHGTRKEEALIQSCVETGLLIPWGTNSRVGGQAYKPFAKDCICFPMKNKANQISGLYFRSTINDSDQKHFYLKESTGLYPKYPDPETEKLILTEAIIDCATLLQIPEITKEYSLLSAYGTNRLTEEHIQAIKEWCLSGAENKEIVFAFDNDEAGNKAAEKYGQELKVLHPQIKLTKIKLEENEDINSTGQSHQSEIFLHLLENRKSLLLSTETTEKPVEKEKALTQRPVTNSLNANNPFKISYQTQTATYYIQGGISKGLDSLKVTLVIEYGSQKSRNKLDLYEDKQVEKLAKEAAEKLNIRKDQIEADLYKLTDLLDKYREEQTENSEQLAETDIVMPLTTKERQEIEAFGKQPDLIEKLNEQLGKAGIVGEEKNRIFLLIIASSYKMPETLHALIQGSSGSGKTRLLKQISDCIPKEKVTKLTRVSDKVLYNYPEKYFINRLLCLEDIDGLSEEAEFAFRELQSNGELNSATSMKLENGQIVAGQKTVKGPIASMACTTKGEIYEDNMGRVFLIAVDESQEQTKRIIHYQNRRAAGGIPEEEEHKTKIFLQNFIREIKPYKVVNPFADKIHLPEEAHKIRRLNDLFQSFVKMITVLNQYQRKKDEKQRLIAQSEDLETAIEIMFESIVLKVDELDGSLRQFYEKLKSHIEKKSRNHEFTRFEVREAIGLGKTQQHCYLNQLMELEYVQQYGFANRGFKYKIVQWDNHTALRERIKKNLQNQLDNLKAEHQPNANRTPERSKNGHKVM